MRIRRTKNSMYNIQKLRNIYYNAQTTILSSKERISLLQRYLSKMKFKNILLKLCTLFIYSYRKETIHLCRDEITTEKQKIENAIVTFEHIGCPNTHTLDKLCALYNQLKKMKVFYQLDGTFYSYDQIDLNDFEKHNFNFFKKDKKLFIEDDMHFYEFNSLFIGKYDNKKSNLLELYSSDNVTIESKNVYFYSKTKKSGLKLKLETWLYHNDDGTKDTSFTDNYPLYVYGFKFIKIKFMSKSFTKEFAFLGNDYDKMELFATLLNEYLGNLSETYYEIISEKQNTSLSQKKLLELFYENPDYSWIIFDILLNNEDLKIMSIHDIYTKYRLNYDDLFNIVNILKRYSLIEITLSMDLICKYKINDIKDLYESYLMLHKESLIKGDNNG